MSERLYLYHTNDLHSHLEQVPKIATYFQEARKRHKRKNESMLVLDIGDNVDLSHPCSEATNGKANVAIMNKLDYEYITIGNNEGITLSKNSLNALYDDAKFEVLVANLFDDNGEYPSWAKPFVIHTLDNGIKVGIIGLTAAYHTFYELLGWMIKDPFDMLPSLVKQLRNEVDVVILLSHLGMYDDERIANEIDGIDVILGGHTHHLFQHGKLINDTLLAATGKYGMHVGEIILSIDKDANKIEKKEAHVISLETIKDCDETIQFLRKLEKESNLLLEETVAVMDKELAVDWFEPSPLASLLCEALSEWCGAELAMLNAGVLLDKLPAGAITRGYLHKILPHPINPCKIVIRGDQLKEVILHSFTNKMQNLQLKGLGFRGKVMGRMIFHGIDIKTEKMDDGLTHVSEIKLHDHPLDPQRLYEVATLDMFTFGFLYSEIKNTKVKQYYLPELLRDILAWKLQHLN